MSRQRTIVLAAGLVGVGVCFALAFLQLPAFGNHHHHGYRTRAVHAAVQQSTANVVSSVNFDQRGIDTFGEETILLGSVIGVAALLRPSKEERESPPAPTGRVTEITRLLGYAMLPISVLVGLDVVTHGAITPGGGFQGGIVLATAIHLLYVAGSYSALERVRPVSVFETTEALGAAAFACLGIAGVAVSASFLANAIPTAPFGQLFSSGTVPLLSGAVGLEVGSGVIVLLSKFLEQAIMLGPE